MLVNEDTIKFFKNLTVRQLTDWFLKSIKTKIYLPLRLYDEPDPIIQLQYIFEDIEPDLQSKFKYSTVTALREWQLNAHGSKTLEDLAFLAAYIRATDAVDVIITIIRSNILEYLPNEEFYRLTEVLLSVLSGFSPSAEIQQLFEKIFYTNLMCNFTRMGLEAA